MCIMRVHRTMKARVCDTHTDLNSPTLATPTCLPSSPILVEPDSLERTIRSISASRAAVADQCCLRAAIPSSFQLYPWYVCNTYHSSSYALTDHRCPILPLCLQQLPPSLNIPTSPPWTPSYQRPSHKLYVSDSSVCPWRYASRYFDMC